MIRNLKVLGLALAAVLALSAVVASAAMAQKTQGELTADGPVTLIGTQTGAATDNALTAFGGETQCPNATYTGHEYNVTPHEPIDATTNAGKTTVTITPHYGSCTALGFPATIDMNGCDYVFHIEKTNVNGGYDVKSTVPCPSGQHITLTIFISSTKHTENKPFCHITITENAAGYAGLEVKTTTGGHLGITGTATGITADKKSTAGSILCPEETTNTASLKQDVTVTGKNNLGQDTALSLTEV